MFEGMSASKIEEAYLAFGKNEEKALNALLTGEEIPKIPDSKSQASKPKMMRGMENIDQTPSSDIIKSTVNFDDSDEDFDTSKPVDQMVEADKEDKPLKIDPKYLVKSEQEKQKDLRMRHTFKNHWKNNQEIIRQEEKLMDKKNKDLLKKRIMQLTEMMEYEDDYDEEKEKPTMGRIDSMAGGNKDVEEIEYVDPERNAKERN